MGETAKDRTRATVEAVPDPEEAAGAHDVGAHRAATCPVAWCPVCLAVSAVQPVRPEVVEHLLKAGTEFFLALRGLIDARAEEVVSAEPSEGDEDDDGLHRIDIG